MTLPTKSSLRRASDNGGVPNPPEDPIIAGCYREGASKIAPVERSHVYKSRPFPKPAGKRICTEY